MSLLPSQTYTETLLRLKGYSAPKVYHADAKGGGRMPCA